ncbi:acyl--CoA ligase [Yinghuangia sp. ASG 101]|uniref:class I adenylate-forming enzyme family protein n=1 Tax=Yinghuangia sp. ASG 101 TaxID=2896848 RepID=UPI001E31BA09|nr:class I adenylate-forming enzyme family protein [Yinghuangia sp. ASG 101]UGQ09201.1 acyl--CoA ligase [Yinghuangia sp. ASG 101]
MRHHSEVMAPRAQAYDEDPNNLVRTHAARHPDSPAIADPPDIHRLTGRPARQWTWAGLDHEVDRLATTFAAYGVRGTDTVAVQLPAGVELVQAVLACWRLGAVPMPLSVGLRDRGLTYRAMRAGARTIVTSVRIGRRQAAATAAALPCFPTVFTWGVEVPRRAVDLAAAGAEAKPGALPRTEIVPDDRAVVLWASPDRQFSYRHRDLSAAAVPTTAESLTNTRALTCPASFHETLVPWLRAGCRLIHPDVVGDNLGSLTGTGRIPPP